MNKTKKISITLLSLIGIALSIELCFVYYNANFAVDAKPSICSINDMMDCDGVAKTTYSQFLGVPLAIWGICLYIFVLFLTYVDKLQNIKFLNFLKVFKNQSSYIFCISLLSFILSMILGCISIFKINSICIFCFMTYFIDLIIALFSKNWGNGILYELKNSIADFLEAIKVKKYAFYFLLLVLLAASILTYTTTSNILSPQMIKRNNMMMSIESYRNIVDKNEMGPKDASVVIHEYIDFNCPGCFLANIYLHRIVSEFENVKVIQHNVPLDITCNHNMKHEGHPNSCLKARYAIAASEQNRYWEMVDILFTDNPETEKSIIEEARLVGFDIAKLKEDANSEVTNQKLKDSIQEADSKNIDGTPTIFINMKRISGIGSYPDLKAEIIEQGGKEKPNHE